MEKVSYIHARPSPRRSLRISRRLRQLQVRN